MIVDNLTKFNQKKKLWMTPKHPMYIRSVDFKILYGAAILIQAEIDSFSNPLNNDAPSRTFREFQPICGILRP